MDDVRAGLILRALRRRARLRQIDLARKVGLSQQSISKMERGLLATSSLDSLRATYRAVGAEYRTEVRWRGAEVDRILDATHAAVVGTVLTRLGSAGWRVETEVTFSHFGERGSIDVLGWHAATGTLLVVEVKSSIASVEELLRQLDVKARLGPVIAHERWGVRTARASRLVALPDDRTERRRVARHAAVLDRALPERGRDVIRWVSEPAGELSGIVFVTPTPASGASRVRGGRHRVDVDRARERTGRARSA